MTPKLATRVDPNAQPRSKNRTNAPELAILWAFAVTHKTITAPTQAGVAAPILNQPTLPMPRSHFRSVAHQELAKTKAK